jgi:hypothetical protein
LEGSYSLQDLDILYSTTATDCGDPKALPPGPPSAILAILGSPGRRLALSRFAHARTVVVVIEKMPKFSHYSETSGSFLSFTRRRETGIARCARSTAPTRRTRVISKIRSDCSPFTYVRTAIFLFGVPLDRKQRTPMYPMHAFSAASDSYLIL